MNAAWSPFLAQLAYSAYCMLIIEAVKSPFETEQEWLEAAEQHNNNSTWCYSDVQKIYISS